jgi:histidinol dehydrogenase
MKIYETSGGGSRKTAKVVAALEQRGRATNDRVTPVVTRIVRDVREGGDKALRKYARKLDGLGDGSSLRVPAEAMRAALQGLAPEMRDALETAIANIGDFARRQMPSEWEMEMAPGVVAGQQVRPLDAVGCYVPSGRYPLPSTLLMTVVPAIIAGVKRIVVVSPKPSQETLAAAALLDIDEFYSIGGAHAVAALAYGTASIPRVNKIVGPGNQYVTAAKRLVSGDCGIDMLAGPTEIGVTSDADTGAADFIAADLVAQSEHDVETLAVLITTNGKLAKAVLKATLTRAEENVTAKKALAKHGYIFLAATKEEACSLTNRLAFEHLTVDSDADVDWVSSAGSVFVGQWSAQPLGDYVSGPNHTLPTGGLAQVRGGLSVLDYVKLMTVQRYAPLGVEALGPAAMTLAMAEGLAGHAEAIRVRLQKVSADG